MIPTLNSDEGMVSLPPSIHIKRVSEYAKRVVREDFDGSDMSTKGCWVLASFSDGSVDIVSEIPRNILAEGDCRALMFGEVIPQMIRDIRARALAFVIPMFYRGAHSPEPQFAVRVLAFDGISFFDYFASGELDEGNIAHINGWAMSTISEGIGADIVRPSQRSMYKMG